MTIAKLKKAILTWANEKGDEVYADDAARKFKVSRRLARKAFDALHKSGQLVCANEPCKRCDP